MSYVIIKKLIDHMLYNHVYNYVTAIIYLFRVFIVEI